MYAKNDDHDAFLYHRWNKTNTNKNTTMIRHCTNKPRPVAVNSKTVAHPPTAIPVKDDLSVTPTLKTLCTLDTCSLNSTTIDNDAILNITIWNQPIAQYQMPIRPLASTRNRSQEHPNTVVQYALIGVYDKLLISPKLPRLLSTLTSIVCVVLSCFILLANSFTLVKIDNWYPDEWND